MPIYEYKCNCGYLFEKIRPMSEYDLPSVCSYCGNEAGRAMSTFINTESECFSVEDGRGNVISRKQVSKYAPAFNDLAARPKDIDHQVDNGVVWDKASGGIFYNRNRP